VLTPGQQLGPQRSDAVDEVVPQAKGYVPHYLPGTNPFLHDETDRFHIPYEAAREGKATSYPEYQLRLKELMRAAATKTDSSK